MIKHITKSRYPLLEWLQYFPSQFLIAINQMDVDLNNTKCPLILLSSPSVVATNANNLGRTVSS